jgi:hypothetical protein
VDKSHPPQRNYSRAASQASQNTHSCLDSIHIMTPTTPCHSLFKAAKRCPPLRSQLQGSPKGCRERGVRRKLAKAKYREVGGHATTPCHSLFKAAKRCPPLRLPTTGVPEGLSGARCSTINIVRSEVMQRHPCHSLFKGLNGVHRCDSQLQGSPKGCRERWCSTKTSKD